VIETSNPSGLEEPIAFQVDIFSLWFVRSLLANLRRRHPGIRWHEERIDWFGKLFTVEVPSGARESVRQEIDLLYFYHGFMIH